MIFFAGQGPPGSQRVGKLSTKQTDNTMCRGISRGHQTSLLASSFPSHVPRRGKEAVLLALAKLEAKGVTVVEATGVVKS